LNLGLQKVKLGGRRRRLLLVLLLVLVGRLRVRRQGGRLELAATGSCRMNHLLSSRSCRSYGSVLGSCRRHLMKLLLLLLLLLLLDLPTTGSRRSCCSCGSLSLVTLVEVVRFCLYVEFC